MSLAENTFLIFFIVIQSEYDDLSCIVFLRRAYVKVERRGYTLKINVVLMSKYTVNIFYRIF